MSSPAALEVLDWRDGHIVALDQTALPHEIRMLHLTTVADLVDAIGRLAIRGAPVLGAAGALGVALAARLAERDGWDSACLDAAVGQIGQARPTAVNLRRETDAAATAIPRGAAAVEAVALAIVDATVAASHQMSERGARYLREVCGPAPLRVETHCNTGSLACLGWGSALGVIRALNHEQALAHVLVDETRPLLQGARLTCWELDQLAIEHYLVADAAGPFLISQGLVDAVVVGADRVAANGDVANKIGTYSLALAARQARIPFVVVVPESTIDPATPDGAHITVERRPEDEVTHVLGVPVAPDGTRALNYAFDITPAALVTAVITEDRVIEPQPSNRLARPKIQVTKPAPSI
jgi:methylthioribose-1-phosphate isomerase